MREEHGRGGRRKGRGGRCLSGRQVELRRTERGQALPGRREPAGRPGHAPGRRQDAALLRRSGAQGWHRGEDADFGLSTSVPRNDRTPSRHPPDGRASERAAAPSASAARRAHGRDGCRATPGAAPAGRAPLPRTGRAARSRASAGGPHAHDGKGTALQTILRLETLCGCKRFSARCAATDRRERAIGSAIGRAIGPTCRGWAGVTSWLGAKQGRARAAPFTQGGPEGGRGGEKSERQAPLAPLTPLAPLAPPGGLASRKYVCIGPLPFTSIISRGTSL